MQHSLAALVLCLCCLSLLASDAAGHAGCGLGAVRHRQDEQLRKLLGPGYQHQQAPRRLQVAAGISFGSSGPPPMTRLQKLLNNSRPANMRITPVYQLEAGYMNAEQAQRLKDVLMPGAINILQQHIKVRIPSFRPIKAVRESIDQYCGDADADVVFKGQGFTGTDQVYYITALNSGSCSDNIIAYTIICHMEPFTYRPNVAAINLCPKFWALAEPAANKQVSALVHEMIHGLGFSDRMYPFLYDSSTGVQYDEVVREHDLSPAPTLSFPRLPLPLPNIAAALPRLPAAFARDRASVNNRVLDADDAAVRSAAAQGSAAAAAGGGASSGEQYNAAAEAAAFLAAAQRKVLFLVTPKLQAYARQYYGCESLPGAPADALSEGSHWRQANINHELMQPASAEDSQRKRISQFTLNFLDDTGWYVTDKTSAQELEWGRNAGCSFVLDGCSSYAASHKNQGYYCTAGQADKDVCTYDSRGIGMCSAIPGTTCFTAKADAEKPLLYCQDAGSFQRAGRGAYASSIAAVGGIVGAASSRCFHTPQQICTFSGNSSSSSKEACGGDDGSAVCMETACDKGGKLLVLLRLQGSDGKRDVVKLPCSDGAVLDLPKLLPSKFKRGQITCPAAASVCPTLGCPQGCSNGYCWQGKCYCHLEFTGPGCSQSLVPLPLAGKVAQSLPGQQRG
ncbi:hypothetical protein OEZ86_008331 [Tetradesmus obliquus]|nr:hypothetical protein OEZ86_008331 [Tetradesmus obliquus]